jgi:hypothetical protein
MKPQAARTIPGQASEGTLCAPHKRRGSDWIFVAAASLCAALALPAQASKTMSEGFCLSRVEGSGAPTSEPRSLGEFATLHVKGSLQVVVRTGEASSATVQAQANLLPLIETTVENGTLSVRTKPGSCWSSREPMVVNLTITPGSLKQLQLAGSGRVDIAGLRSERLAASLAGSGDLSLMDSQVGALKASLAGSGDVHLEGSGESVEIRVAGSGDVQAKGWKAQQAQVSVSGSGDVEVWSAQALSASVAGSGDVRYWGKPPKVQSRVAGSGTVESAER